MATQAPILTGEIRTSLAGRTRVKNADPALKCWAAFTGSLRDRSTRLPCLDPFWIMLPTAAESRFDSSRRILAMKQGIMKISTRKSIILNHLR